MMTIINLNTQGAAFVDGAAAADDDNDDDNYDDDDDEDEDHHQLGYTEVAASPFTQPPLFR